MRVVVNQLAALGRRTGVGHYTAELLHGLRGQTPDGTVTAFPGPLVRRARQAWGWLRQRRSAGGAGGGGASAGPSMRGLARVILGRYFRTLCRLRRFDVYHEPNYLPLPCEVPTVATVHDLSVLLHPEWHPADRVAAFERDFRDGLRQCTHVLTDTDCVRREIMQTLGLPPERVTRAYVGIRRQLRPLAADEVRRGREALGLPPEYLLFVGTLEPRKNVLRLLRVYCSLPEAVRSRWPLVLVGGWGWNAGDVADYLHGEARHRGVRHLGYVADADLPVLYNAARALVYPSLYEGFGLPPVEMLACGGAVLASTAGALAETVGGQAHLIPAEDEDGWRAAMLRVVADDDWWQALRRGAVAAARRYTWENCAAATLRVYRKVCGQAEREAGPAEPLAA
jgi:alpha-1,3-rhamnosyl/mannosyltransferase